MIQSVSVNNYEKINKKNTNVNASTSFGNSQEYKPSYLKNLGRTAVANTFYAGLFSGIFAFFGSVRNLKELFIPKLKSNLKTFGIALAILTPITAYLSTRAEKRYLAQKKALMLAQNTKKSDN